GYDDGVIQSRKTIIVQGQTLPQAGAINVIYGGPNGLQLNNPPGAKFLTLNNLQSPGQRAAKGDLFGRALADADFNHDGYQDLGIGPRQETLIEGQLTIKQAGAINVIYGGPSGLQVDAGPGNQFWTEDTPGLPGGGAKPNDWFGRPLKAGDFNLDG